MTEEQRVGFDNAKILKEKEFNCINPPMFFPPRSLHIGTPMYDKNGNSHLASMPEIAILQGYCYSPTQQVAIDWIFINFDIHINLDLKHTKSIGVELKYISTDISEMFKTPEQSRESAINYFLINLI